MLLLVLSIKLVAEAALMALIGRGVLAMLAGAGREHNVFYQLLSVVTRPFIAAARRITPRIVIDRHLPLVAMLLLMLVWLAALVMKVRLCLVAGMAVCQ
jgi:uncharacterized protein YggT (Ycf19 family)